MTTSHDPSSAGRPSPALKRTALFQEHVSLGARLVPFAGWEMPIQYAGILSEARAVRSGVGIFDVSHMGRVELTGAGAPAFLHRLVTADVLGMRLGRARYTLICNDAGGIIDDTIIYRLDRERLLLIPNAANTDTVVDWLERCRQAWSLEVDLRVFTDETGLISVQGPEAAAMLQPACSMDLSAIRPFACAEGALDGAPAVICRTGYTGEDGFEVILPAADAPGTWRGLVERGAKPCGLGARDVLRLEAGLLLHGTDMDVTVTPLEAGLGRFVIWGKDEFNGSSALKEQKEAGISRVLAGFRMLDRGIPRSGYPILGSDGHIGTVTSGTHSPALDTGIGLGYVPLERAAPGNRFAIDLRGRRAEAEVVALPFYSRRR